MVNVMIEDELTARARNIVATHLGVDSTRVTAEANFRDDLGADSLDRVELAMGLEEEFNLMIPDSDIDKMLTFGDTVAWLREHVR
jgi:acyl carrier protein